MKTSNKRSENKTTARIGDEVTEINGIRTANMTKDAFEIEQNKEILEFYYTLVKL